MTAIIYKIDGTILKTIHAEYINYACTDFNLSISYGEESCNEDCMILSLLHFYILIET